MNANEAWRVAPLFTNYPFSYSEPHCTSCLIKSDLWGLEGGVGGCSHGGGGGGGYIVEASWTG